MSGEMKKSPSKDVAVLCGPTEDGKGARILRAREGTLEAGEIRPVKDGQPINQGELVRLIPRDDASCVCDVETLHKSAPVEEPPPQERSERTAAGRPAQVATDDYRTNWERTFDGHARRKRQSSLN